MPSKRTKRIRAGGVRKQDGTSAESADEIVKAAEAQRIDAEKHTTSTRSSAPDSSEDDGIVTAPNDDDEKSSQVAAKSAGAQKVINPNDPFAWAEGGATTGHGTLPTKEAAAKDPITEGPRNIEMEDTSVEKKIDCPRTALLETQPRAAEKETTRWQEQWKYAEAKVAEAQSRTTELEVQLQAAMDEVAVLQEFRQSRYEGETIKSKRSSRRSFGAAKALHCISRNRPVAVASSKEKPASDSVSVTVGHIMTATPDARPRTSHQVERMADAADSPKVGDWLSELTKDPALREICKLPDEARASALSNMSLALEGERLYKVFPDGRKVLVVPASCRRKVFDKAHASVGHYGWRATVTAVLREYYWHGVRNDIAKWLKQCEECPRNKIRSGKAKRPGGRSCEAHRCKHVAREPISTGQVCQRVKTVVNGNAHKCKDKAHEPKSNGTRDRRKSRGRRDGQRKTIGAFNCKCRQPCKIERVLHGHFDMVASTLKNKDGYRFSRTFGANNFVAKNIRTKNSSCAAAMNSARGAPLVEEGVPQLSSADVNTVTNNCAETNFGRRHRDYAVS